MCLRLESAGQLVKVDSGLCQPAGTPIFVQNGRRLGVTFVGDVETNILCPVHISVERRITLLADVQSALDTLTIVFPTAHATRLACVPLGHFYDFNTLDFRLVFENIGETVERPAVQVEVAVPTPILRVAVLVLADAFQVTDVDATNISLHTPLDDVFGETVEKMGATLRPLVVQAGGSVTTRVVAFSDFFREGLAVLFQLISGVQVGFLGTVRDRREVTDTKVNTC